MVYAPFLAGQKPTADDLNTDIVSETMAWTPLASLGSFGTNFSAHPTSVPRIRKIVVAGTPEWQFEGRINASAFAVNSLLTMFTFSSSSNFPSAERGGVGYASSSGLYMVRLGLTAAGLLQGGVPAAAPTSTSSIWLDQFRITNP